MLVADRAAVPTYREIKNPSTMVYMDKNSIITMDGAANRSSSPVENSREIPGVFIKTSFSLTVRVVKIKYGRQRISPLPLVSVRR